MTEMWKQLRIEDYKYWVDTILSEASDLLSNWETTFIESLDARLSNGFNLSQAQAEKLEQIYANKTK